MSCSHSIAEVQAIQEVEYLRRRYARATDLIGTATPEAIAEGRAIYRAVFAADAKLKARPDRDALIGPDAWLDLVLTASRHRGPTQHLIGTQLVQIKSLEVDDGCNVIAGKASMESYVQAWHELKNGKVWLFLGTYFDDVEYVTNEGWRITETTLQQVAGETRHMDKAAGLAADS